MNPRGQRNFLKVSEARENLRWSSLVPAISKKFLESVWLTKCSFFHNPHGQRMHAVSWQEECTMLFKWASWGLCWELVTGMIQKSFSKVAQASGKPFSLALGLFWLWICQVVCPSKNQGLCLLCSPVESLPLKQNFPNQGQNLSADH